MTSHTFSRLLQMENWVFKKKYSQEILALNSLVFR